MRVGPGAADIDPGTAGISDTPVHQKGTPEA